jgi:hypothetical protein
MSGYGKYFPIKHTHSNDCYINAAGIQSKKLNIFNVSDPVSQVSQQGV